MKKPLVKVNYRSIQPEERNATEEFVLQELTDQSIRNIKKIITKDDISCSTLKDRICWNPLNIAR